MTAKTAQIDQAERRLRMINGQLRTCDVTDSAVLQAFLVVPRERFVAPAMATLAYLDLDIPASGAQSRKLLAPRTLARLIQAAEPKPGERALDVGGGSGYSAAILATMGAKVVALESDSGAAAAAGAALKDFAGAATAQGDLAAGAAGQGPFDVILINGAFESLPVALIDQLADGGRLVGVDARTGAVRGCLIEKSGAGYSERSLFDAKAGVLPEFKRTQEFAF